MGVFEHFPYTNYHELNLDWVIEEVKRCVALCENVEKEIDAKVTAILTEWLDDGTIADLINVTIFTNLEARVSACEAKLALLSETPKLINEVKLAPFIYDDSVTSNSQGMCADPDSGYIYSWESGTFPNGKIHVYDSATMAEVQTFNNVAAYHCNDMEKIGNLIYIAQCYATSNVLDGNKLLAFNVSNQSIADIRSFPSPAITAVANVNDEDLIILGNPGSNQPNIGAFTFYRYNIAADAYALVSLVAADCPLFTATQGSYFDKERSIYHLLVSGPDMILSFRFKEDVLTYVSCTKLAKRDYNGIQVGEYEALASLNGSDLFVSHIIQNIYSGPYSFCIGIVNLFKGYPIFKIPYNYHSPLNTDEIAQCDASYSGLYEDGTATYPFKTAARAIEALNFSGRFRLINMAAGSYGDLEIRDRKVYIDTTGAVSFGTITFTLCDVKISGSSGKEFTTTGMLTFTSSHGFINYGIFADRVRFYGSDFKLYNIVTSYTANYPITGERSVIAAWWLAGSASLFNGYAAYISGFTSMTINQVVTAAQIQKPGTNWTLIRGGFSG